MARSSSPTAETLFAFLLVFAVEHVGSRFGVQPLSFALMPPISARPWTLVTSIYAHAGFWHLTTNVVTLLVLGLAVERATTRARFHGFFVLTGAFAGAAQITVSRLLGQSVAVVGASGAIFALMGYLVTGNTLSSLMFARANPGPFVQALAFVLLAAGVTLFTGEPRAALVAHFTGFAVGLLLGRTRTLHAYPRETQVSNKPGR